jgi:DNA-binding IclR family transcriptional regulator
VLRPVGKENGQIKEGSKSLRRALLLLRTVAACDSEGKRLTELATMAGLHTTTTHRLLSALQDEGMVSIDANTKLYKLGVEMLLFGESAHRQTLRDTLRPALTRIAAEGGEDVHLIVPTGDDHIIIDKVEGSAEVRITSPIVGCRRPQGVGAGSIAFMAACPHDEARRRYERNLPYYENVRWTTPERIWRDIVQARRRGFSVVHGQLVKDATALAVAVARDSGEPVAAITVFAPNSRMTVADRKRLARLIRREVSALGGFKTPVI